MRVFERERRFIGAYELQKYTDGATKAGPGLHGHTVQEIGQEYCRRRKQFKKVKLRWRVSGGAPIYTLRNLRRKRPWETETLEHRAWVEAFPYTQVGPCRQRSM